MKLSINKKLKTYVGLALLSVALLASSCVVDPDHDDYYHSGHHRYSASQDFSFEIDTADHSGLQLYAVNGSVEIVGVSNLAKAEIRGEMRVESDSRSDAEEHLGLLDVEVDSLDSSLIVRTMQPTRSDGRNYIVHYHLRVPANWRAAVDQSNGEIRLIGLMSAATVRADNGEVFAESLEDSLLAGVVNGSLVLKNIYGSVSAEMVNGSISGDVSLPPDGECVLKMTNGPIMLRIPVSTSARFSAGTVNGTVQVHGLTFYDLQSSRKSVQGTLGQGRGRIELKSVNGDIVVSGSN